MKPICIGIDFDNTIIDYTKVLLKAARNYGWLGFDGEQTMTKQEIRDAIRCLPDGEKKWTRLQALAYGELIREACVIEGAMQFIRSCLHNHIQVFIISQKTLYAELDTGRRNLRKEAFNWLERHGFFNREDVGLDKTNVFFEETLIDKLCRISKLGCTHFIDDLEEVLNHSRFPKGVTRILFSQGAPSLSKFNYPVFSTWKDIEGAIFNYA